jgi:hypothetical protein
MDIQTLRDRLFVLVGQAEEARRIYEAAVKESNDNAAKEQNNKSRTVDTGHTEVLTGESAK